jgi:hypothetical protein
MHTRGQTAGRDKIIDMIKIFFYCVFNITWYYSIFGISHVNIPKVNELFRFDSFR